MAASNHTYRLADALHFTGGKLFFTLTEENLELDPLSFGRRTVCWQKLFLMAAY